MMMRFCSPRSLSRNAVQVSRVFFSVKIASPAASSPARYAATLPSVPGEICVKPAACRPSLMACELMRYKRERCRRTLLRICHASSGCWSVGLLPITSIAEAL